MKAAHRPATALPCPTDHQVVPAKPALLMRLQRAAGNAAVAALPAIRHSTDDRHSNTWALQLQPVVSKASGGTLQSVTGRNQVTKAPVTLPAVTTTVPKTRKDLLASIRSIEGTLEKGPASGAELKQMASRISALQKALLAAPIKPPPKRDFIGGPIRFVGTTPSVMFDTVDPRFFSFHFQSLDDKAWKETFMALYKLAVGPWAIVLSTCEAILSQPDEDLSYDRAGEEIRMAGSMETFAAEQGKSSTSYFLQYGVAEPMKKYGEDFMSKEAAAVGKGAARLAFVIDAALTAYDIYAASTKGPSLHAAAVETTARVMGRAFNMARGIGMHRGQGGEFVQHASWSEVRVAANPLDRTPLPAVKDRRLAYDMVGNRVYEMMTSVLTPQHLASREAFDAFRNARVHQAGAIVDNAGATIVEDSEKYGGTMVLIKIGADGHAYKVDKARVR